VKSLLKTVFISLHTPIFRIKLITAICLIGFPVNILFQSIHDLYYPAYFGLVFIAAELLYVVIYMTLCVMVRKNLKRQRPIQISQMLAFGLIFTVLSPLWILGGILSLYVLVSKKKSSLFKLEFIAYLSFLMMLGISYYSVLRIL
jgi:hypothetical protein